MVLSTGLMDYAGSITTDGLIAPVVYLGPNYRESYAEYLAEARTGPVLPEAAARQAAGAARRQARCTPQAQRKQACAHSGENPPHKHLKP